jgi:membrane protease subunit HflK
MILLAVVVIAVVALLLTSFYMVDQTEKAVILRFGRFVGITGPGLHFKLPLGIDQNYIVPISVQDMSFGYRTERAGITTTYSKRDYPEESIMLTGDLNIVDVEWSIQYQIIDPRAWLFNIENKEKTIRDISQSVLNLLVGDRAILDVIGSERSNIEVAALERMNEIFTTYDMGIRVIQMQLQNVVPPVVTVLDAFEDVNKAIQDMNRLINEGKEEYNKEIPKTRGQADQMIQEAQGYATERVNQARGDVARFLSVRDEYRRNRDVTRARLYIEMIENVFSGQGSTDLIDRNLDNFIPLKNLGASSRGGTQ